MPGEEAEAALDAAKTFEADGISSMFTRLGENVTNADEAIQARYDSGSVISTPREFLEEETRQHLTDAGDGRLCALSRVTMAVRPARA